MKDPLMSNWANLSQAIVVTVAVRSKPSPNKCPLLISRPSNVKIAPLFNRSGIMRLSTPIIRIFILLLVAAFSTSCSSVNGPKNEHDPLESYNRAMFEFNEGFYEYLLDPVTRGYQTVTPDFVETGVSNFFSHLGDVTVMVNDLLQFKMMQFVEDFMRFVYNTFFGLLGTIDVASHMGLPKHHEDFGQTLATWGVGRGPYFVLPILGPSTIRDTTGLVADWQYDPITEIKDDQARYATIALYGIDARAGTLKATKILEEASFDKYAFMRDAYLQHRNNLVHDGHPPRETMKDEPLSKEELELEDELEKELLKSP